MMGFGVRQLLQEKGLLCTMGALSSYPEFRRSPMRDFSTWLETVNGMSVSRRRGYGHVSAFLRNRQVPRADAYRWEQELREWHDGGKAELEALRREREEWLAKRTGLPQGTRSLASLGREQEWALIVEASVLGTSDEEIVALIGRAGGRRRSHQYVHEVLVEVAAVARLVYERYFAGVGRVWAADEIFLGSEPLLLAVGPLSLLISGLRLAKGRGAEDWKPVFAGARELRVCSADEAKGLRKGRQEAKVALQSDMRHLLTKGWTFLAALERAYEPKAKAVAAAEREVERARFCGGKSRGISAKRQLWNARVQAERALAEYCRLGDLMGEVAGAFEYTTKDGRLATAAGARARVAAALAAMRQTPEGQRLAKKLRGLENPWAFAYLDAVEEGLADLSPEPGGPERTVWLGGLVAETVAWRRTDKIPVEWLAKASNGSRADEAELKVIAVFDEGIRSSSYVECVNSRVRLVQVARKRMSEDFICLLAVHHNMKRFGRGSVRKGWTPAQLAGIQLPTDDWLELLKNMAKELGKPLLPALDPAA